MSSLIALNFKIFTKPLIALIVFSIFFFYAEFAEPYMIKLEKVEDLLALVSIISGLFILSGIDSKDYG